MAMIIVSTIVSAITAKIVATYYFKKVDGYVKEMCEMTIKSNGYQSGHRVPIPALYMHKAADLR